MEPYLTNTYTFEQWWRHRVNILLRSYDRNTPEHSRAVVLHRMERELAHLVAIGESEFG